MKRILHLASTTSFSAVAFATAGIYWLLISVPMLGQWLAGAHGIDPIEALTGVDSAWGAGKVHAARALGLATLAMLVAFWAARLWRPGRARRTVALLVSATAIAVSFLWLDALPRRYLRAGESFALERLAIATASPLPDHFGRIGRRPLLAAPVVSLTGLREHVAERYSQDSALVAATWPMVEGPQTRRAVHAMNTVSSLWAFGNSKGLGRVGCIGSNETTAGVEVASLDVRAYLASPIACCSDYAALLKYLLDGEGIRNRLVHISAGHVFNEAELDGRWVTLDPTINVMYGASWYGVNRRGSRKPVQVILFPHAGEDPTSSLWRPAVGRFRTFMLLHAAMASYADVTYTEQLEPGSLPGSGAPGLQVSDAKNSAMRSDARPSP